MLDKFVYTVNSLAKTDTFGSEQDDRRIEGQISVVKTGTNSRCPFYRGVPLIEMSVKRESTAHVNFHFFSDKKSL